jgi:DNA-binding LytR/AlgR family response regulator
MNEISLESIEHYDSIKEATIGLSSSELRLPSLKCSLQVQKLPLEKILFFQAFGNYIKVYIEEEILIIHERISFIELILKDKPFLREHKSYIISLSKLTDFEEEMAIIQHHKIPVSRASRKNFKVQIQKGEHNTQS